MLVVIYCTGNKRAIKSAVCPYKARIYYKAKHKPYGNETDLMHRRHHQHRYEARSYREGIILLGITRKEMVKKREKEKKGEGLHVQDWR